MATATATLKRMCINGQWVEADSGKTLEVINPATEEPIAAVAYGGRGETRRAIEAAHAAMPAWRKKTPWERASPRTCPRSRRLSPIRPRAFGSTHSMPWKVPGSIFGP